MREKGDSNFMALKQRVKNLSRKEITTYAPWISDITWSLEDQMAEMGRKCIANQGEHRILMWRFQVALKEDRRCRVRRAVGGVEALVVKYHLR